MPTQSIGRRPAERTPLLRSITERTENEAAIEEWEGHAEGALDPGVFPELGKRRSYSHSHWLAPDDDSNVRPEPEEYAQFEANGLLWGLSRTKFWLIYGGILLGYFVSALSYPK